jgi:hypothetical protein
VLPRLRHQGRESAQLPSKAPFSKRFEDAVGQACQSAAARQVALRFGLPASTVRSIDLRYLERWAAARRKPALAQMGVDENIEESKQKELLGVAGKRALEMISDGAGLSEVLNELCSAIDAYACGTSQVC